MTWLLDRFLPTPAIGLAAATAGLVVGCSAGALAAWARRSVGLAAPYTRKLFHFLVFSAAVGIQWAWGPPGTAAYGSVVAGLVVLAVIRGRGNPLFEALARPTDRPRRALFVVVPLLSTAAGGLGSNLLSVEFAVVGYLVAGWGDAIAEPVGVRWGRHPYRVPSLGGVPARRSVEGSAAVLAASSLAAWTGFRVLGFPGVESLGPAAVCGIVAVAVEAVSHHGLDNLTLQVATTFTAAALLGS